MYDLIIIPENTGEFDTTELSKLINVEEKELREKNIKCYKLFIKNTFFN